MPLFRRRTPAAPPPPPSGDAGDAGEAALRALQQVWAGRGDLAAMQRAAEACRVLSVPHLRLLAAWLPEGDGITAKKCRAASRVVAGVIAEKTEGNHGEAA